MSIAYDEKSIRCQQFRHASELTKESKGGYLEETIRFDIPPNESIEAITLSLVNDAKGSPHPNVLYITPVKERKRRKPKSGGDGDDDSAQAEEAKKPLPEIKNLDYQVEILFREDKLVTRHSYLRRSLLDPDGYLDVSSCWDPEAKVLTLGTNKSAKKNGESVSKGLQLTVVKPKQTGKVSNPDDLYVDTTLMRKLEQVKSDGGKVTQDLKSLANDFRSVKNGVGDKKSSLHKVHLMVTCRLVNCRRPIVKICPVPILDKDIFKFTVSQVFPTVICDSAAHQMTILTTKSGAKNPSLCRLLDSAGNVVTKNQGSML